MFHLVNKFGNVHKHVKDARKRDELIAAGYKLVKEPEEVAPYNGPQDAAHVEGAIEGEQKPKKGKAKKAAEE